MTGTRIALVVGLVVAALAVAGCAGDDEDAATDTQTTTETTSSAPTVLKGNVGPGFEIRMTTEGGQPLKTVPSGSYIIEVDDLSEAHNFHLSGPGIDEKTVVEATGTTRWAVDLQDGTYTFVCDPHKSSMSGSFKVTGT
jgi:plastocyanin